MDPNSQRVLLGAAGAGGETSWISGVSSSQGFNNYYGSFNLTNTGKTLTCSTPLGSTAYVELIERDKDGICTFKYLATNTGNVYRGGACYSADLNSVYAAWSMNSNNNRYFQAYSIPAVPPSVNTYYLSDNQRCNALVVPDSSSGDALIIGESNDNWTNYTNIVPIITKVDSSGAASYRKVLQFPEPPNVSNRYIAYVQYAVTDGTYTYIGAQQQYPGSSSTANGIYKILNSTGARQWANYDTSAYGFYALHYSSVNNTLYASTNQAGSNVPYIYRINPSNGSRSAGPVRFDNWSQTANNCVVTDSAGNIWVLVVSTASGLSGTSAFLYKFTSSFSPLKKYRFQIDNSSTMPTSGFTRFIVTVDQHPPRMLIDSKDNIYININAQNYNYVFKFVTSDIDTNLLGNFAIDSAFGGSYFHMQSLSLPSVNTDSVPSVVSLTPTATNKTNAFSATSVSTSGSVSGTTFYEF